MEEERLIQENRKLENDLRLAQQEIRRLHEVCRNQENQIPKTETNFVVKINNAGHKIREIWENFCDLNDIEFDTICTYMMEKEVITLAELRELGESLAEFKNQEN